MHCLLYLHMLILNYYMADGANISPEQGGEKPTPVQPPKNAGLDRILSEEAERHKYVADRLWGNVQKEAKGEPTELTRPGVASLDSRTLALAAKEGLLSDRKTAENLIRELNKAVMIRDMDRKQQRADGLLNDLRVSQGKPPVVPVPPQAPQPAIKVKNQSGINPLNWFRKKS